MKLLSIPGGIHESGLRLATEKGWETGSLVFAQMSLPLFFVHNLNITHMSMAQTEPLCNELVKKR